MGLLVTCGRARVRVELVDGEDVIAPVAAQRRDDEDTPFVVRQPGQEMAPPVRVPCARFEDGRVVAEDGEAAATLHVNRVDLAITHRLRQRPHVVEQLDRHP
jgi:hypothetical protein